MDRHRQVTRCYSIAVYRLRQRHDSEFQEILAEVYKEEGLDVRKRPSRKSQQTQREA